MKGTLPNPDWHYVFLDGEVWYYCNEEVVYNSHEGHPITIPPRFLHNGGSIPWIFTSGLKGDGIMLSYYALHDYVYKSDCPYRMTRKRADQLLLEYGRYCGYPVCKRNAVYAGVRLGGRFSWHTREATFYPLKHEQV